MDLILNFQKKHKPLVCGENTEIKPANERIEDVKRSDVRNEKTFSRTSGHQEYPALTNIAFFTNLRYANRHE